MSEDASCLLAIDKTDRRFLRGHQEPPVSESPGFLTHVPSPRQVIRQGVVLGRDSLAGVVALGFLL